MPTKPVTSEAPPRGATAVSSTYRPVVLLTGASSGIGRATALRLATTGWRQLLSGTDTGRLTEVALQSGGRALPADLCRPDGPESLAAQALEVTGRVDALIANAGVGWRGPFAEMPTLTIDQLVELNLTAPMRLVRLLLPGMLERGAGRIVLVGSIAGSVGVGGEAVYAATKAALVMFAECLRYELRHTGIHVCLVHPGAVDTPFFARRGTPYDRGWPHPISPDRVATAILAALRTRRSQIFVPSWLALPTRIHGITPALFERLSAKFG